MTAGTYDIVAEKGATLRRVFSVTNAAGAPVSYANHTGRMQVRRDHTSASVILEASTTNGRLLINGPAGTITLLITDEDTAQLPAGAGVYDIMLTNGAGETTKFLSGRFVIQPSVTR
jgi:hypothetical protein